MCAFHKAIKGDLSLPVKEGSTRDVTDKMAQFKMAAFFNLGQLFPRENALGEKKNYRSGLLDERTKQLYDQKNIILGFTCPLKLLHSYKDPNKIDWILRALIR